jgi:transposase InsO family protein
MCATTRTAERHGMDSLNTFRFYNTERPPQGLGNRTPADVYFGRN